MPVPFAYIPGRILVCIRAGYLHFRGEDDHDHETEREEEGRGILLPPSGGLLTEGVPVGKGE